METVDEVEAESKTHEATDDDGLQDILNRLSHLAQEKETTLFSDEAESIIRDIEQILAISLKAKESTRRVSKRRRESYEDNSNEDRDLQYQREVKRIKGHLTPSLCVGVNEKGILKVLNAITSPLTSIL